MPVTTYTSEWKNRTKTQLLDDLHLVIEQRDKALARAAAAGALLDAEVADTTESRVRHARANVRCLDCGLRYEEREEYGCHQEGYGHSYDDGDLADAERDAGAEPVEHATLSVADLRAALGIA